MTVKITKAQMRDPQGRFLRAKCNDPNCDGVLRADIFFGHPVWRCDGLTHVGDHGPLIACARQFDRLLAPAGRRLLQGGDK